MFRFTRSKRHTLGVGLRAALLAGATALVPIALALPSAPAGAQAASPSMYWLASPSHDPTPPRSLPPAKGNAYTLPIPTEFARGDARIEVLDVSKGRVAHIPLRSEGAHPTLIVTAPRRAVHSTLGGNLLQNSDFSRGMEKWLIDPFVAPAHAEIQAPVDVRLPDGSKTRAVRAIVLAIGKLNWHIQFFQGGLTLQENHPYTVSFWARASQERPLGVYASLNIPDWHKVGLDSLLTLTTGWRKYTYSFVAQHTVPGQCRLTFALGDALGQIEIANVTLQSGRESEAPTGIARATARFALHPSDFRFAPTVTSTVRHNGQPVQNAFLVMQAGKQVIGQHLLQPAENGTATFTDVPMNEKLTIVVSSGRQSASFYRMVTPDAPNSVPEITLPDNWKVAGATQDKPAASAVPAALPVTGQKVAASSPHDNRPMVAAVGMSVVVLVAGGLFWLIDTGRVGARTGREVAFAPMLSANGSNVPRLNSKEASLPLGKLEVVGHGPRLVALHGVHAGRVFEIAEKHTPIGRDLANTIVLLQDNTVSRHHAHIEVDGEQYLMVDDESSNGTYVNGVPIAVQRPLKPGDEVQIGMTRFRFEV